MVGDTRGAGGRAAATVAGLVLLLGPVGFYLVFSLLVDNGVLALGTEDPPIPALERLAWPALWASLAGLPLLAYGRSLSAIAAFGLLVGGVVAIAIAWFFIVGVFFGGVSGNPF